jgi:parvulin-like peptidyl-prolyl isomerase
MKTRLLPILPLLGVACLSGCAWFRRDDAPTPVTAADFYAPTTLPAPMTPLVPQLADRPAPVAPTSTATDAPASRHAPVIPVGTYMTIGGVLAEVNGVPIFASRVLHEIEPILRTRARELTAAQFQDEAARLMDKQIRELIFDEITYAAAQHNLEQDDKKLADALTTDFRQKLIQDAGGSLQQARRAAADRGDDFEQIVKLENRRYLVRIFQQKKIFPRLQITTADMRRYYRDNVDKLFTERASATVRIIRIDPARSGGRAAALEKIQSIRDRAVKGKESFATLAGTANDDGSLLRSKGQMTLTPGSLAAEKLEAAIFKTDPGGITEIVDDVGGFYIAKVEARTNGSVKPFEDPAVQRRIEAALADVQQRNLMDQFSAEQLKNSVVYQDDRMKETALELIAQRYPIWHEQ